jgi:hypothetical protein
MLEVGFGVSSVAYVAGDEGRLDIEWSWKRDESDGRIVRVIVLSILAP